MPAPLTPLPRSLRIAFLVNPFNLAFKGGEYAPSLARELLGLGHSVRGFGAPPGVIPRSGADPEKNSGAKSGSGIRAYAPDVIVAYDALSPAAFMGARAARKLQLPLVLIEAGTNLRGRILARFWRWFGERLWGRFVRKHTSTVIALDPVARLQSLSEGFSDAVISVLPQGVDLTRYRPGLASNLLARHQIRGRVILYVGKIAHNRGLEALIHAFGQTVGQGRDWSLVLAGGGSAAARLALRAQVDRLGVGAAVHWLSLPRKEELPGLLGSATLLVVPAVDDRVRGIQIPRALACGLPVLASDLPRLANLMDHDGCGLLVEAGSLSAWTDALRRACGSPEARKRWALRGREIAESCLDWAVVAEAVERRIYKALAEPSEEVPRDAQAAG